MVRGSRFAARIVQSLVLWAILAGLYLVVVGQGSTDELVAAGLTGLAGTLLSLLVRLTSGQAIAAAPWTVLRLIASGVAAVPWDVLVVGGRMLAPHPTPGGTAVQPLQQAGRTAGAIEIMAISVAPNRFVIGLVRRDHVLIHTLSS